MLIKRSTFTIFNRLFCTRCIGTKKVKMKNKAVR